MRAASLRLLNGTSALYGCRGRVPVSLAAAQLQTWPAAAPAGQMPGLRRDPRAQTKGTGRGSVSHPCTQQEPQALRLMLCMLCTAGTV